MTGCAIPKLNFGDLEAFAASLPDEMRKEPGGTVAGIAFKTVAHFFGADWFASHIRHDSLRRGFLNLDFSSNERREASTFRVIELAENLYNLQHIEGFTACIDQMRGGGEKVESTCAELDFGRFLYIHDIPFQFIVPQMVKGADYDFEVTYPDGLKVAADAKCKIEAAAIDPDTLRNSIRKARSQLPDDRPGIVFAKVPQTWLDDPATVQRMVSVARAALASTGRIVSVKFYVSVLQIGDGMVWHRHAFREITNLSSRFHGGRNWDLFANYVVPSSWNGMPPKWQRIFLWPA
jgi:hypothetical protein